MCVGRNDRFTGGRVGLLWPPNELRFSCGHEPATTQTQFFLLGGDAVSCHAGPCPGRPASCKRWVRQQVTR